MILSDKSIEEAISSGSIKIEPFEKSNLKGASYTFTLSKLLLTLREKSYLEVGVKPEYDEQIMTEEGYLLPPNAFIVGYTREKLTLNGKYGCILSARGSLAQMGLSITLGSTFAEPDTDNTQAIEIHNTSGIPIKLKPGMKIAKGVFLPIQ